jgi:hypothetical protein
MTVMLGLCFDDLIFWVLMDLVGLVDCVNLTRNAKQKKGI